jgi:ankyrin repeat protein
MARRECEFLDLITALIEVTRMTNRARFLWVHFQLADLCDAVSDFGIRETLRNLPDGMAATYARISQKIARSRTDMTLAGRVFKWIICAKRPLLLTELTEATAFGPTDQFWDSKKIPSASRLIQACKNLVVFNEEDKTVRLAHHTVQQFLLEPPARDSIPDIHFQLSQADAEAGEICVAYLSFSDFERQITIPQPSNVLLASALPGPAAILDRTTSTLGLRNITTGLFKFGQYRRTGSTRYQMLNFDLGKFAKLRKRPPPNLREKYLFLDYAIENWIAHTLNFSEDNTTMWEAFKHLAMDKPMPFDVRIWDDSTVLGDLPYITLFRWAVHVGHIALLKLLLQLPTGSNLHTYCAQESEEGRSITLNAAKSGHGNMIRFLASQGCIDIQDKTPLLEAAKNGYDFAVRTLLEYKLGLEWKTEALSIASQFGHGAVMNALLKNEPPVDLQNGWGKVALTEAMEKQFDEVLEVLLSRAADFEVTVIDIERVWGNTALHAVSKRGLDRVARLLLENGADVDVKDSVKATALHQAAAEGHEAVMRLLLEKRADVAAKDKLGWTALHQAAEKGHVAVVQLLLEKGANVVAKDESGWTALHRAAGKGHRVVVQLLLEKEGDVDIKDFAGVTALHRAAVEGYEAVVQLLLKNGADVDVKDEYGWTALRWAAAGGNEAVVQQLLKNGADVAAKDDFGWTALHQAAEKGHVAVVQLLLEEGANITAKDEYGWTALQGAVMDEAVVRLLLEKGIDIAAKDSDCVVNSEGITITTSIKMYRTVY